MSQTEIETVLGNAQQSEELQSLEDLRLRVRGILHEMAYTKDPYSNTWRYQGATEEIISLVQIYIQATQSGELEQ